MIHSDERALTASVAQWTWSTAPPAPWFGSICGFGAYLGRLSGMAQRAAQFWRRETFLIVGGYDETMYMGEDVEFCWRMARTARQKGRKLCYISDVQVVPSAPRFDRWPLWKTLLWTNPVFVALLCRQKSPWRGWYEDAPR